MAYLGRKGALAALTSADIPDNSITAAKIVEGTITVGDIGTNAVGTDEIVNDAVTADKLANSINTDIATGVTANTTANAALPTTTAASTYAPLASPDFTGTVDLTGTTVSLDDDEISLNKVDGGTLGTGTIGGSSVVNTSGAITTTSNSGITVNSGLHAYAVLNASATNRASWLQIKQGGTSRWLVGCESNQTDIQFYDGAGGASRLRVAQAGDVTVNTGNLVIGTAGKGITFSSTNTPTQLAGSGTSNTLDDYEEGTWTPTQGSGITLVGSFTSYGWYTKIGNIVALTAWILGSTSIAISVGSNTFIGGLPFQLGGGVTEHRYIYQAGSSGGGGGYAWNTNFYNYGLSPNISATGSKIYFQLTYKV